MNRHRVLILAKIFWFLVLFCLDRTNEAANTTDFVPPYLPSDNGDNLLSTKLTTSAQRDIRNSTEEITSSTERNITNPTERNAVNSTERDIISSTENIIKLHKMLKTSRNVDSSLTPEVTTKNPISQWLNIERRMKEIINSVLKQFLPNIIRMFSTIELSGPCYSSLLKTALAVRKLKSWAMKMLDASGKIPSGIAEGTTTTFGAYDLCLGIIANNKRTKKVDFRGKYCLLEILSPFPTTPLDPRLQDTILGDFARSAHLLQGRSNRIGLCVPSTCTHQDVDKVAHVAFQDALHVSVPQCDVKEELNLSAEQIGVLSLLGTLLLLVVSGTTLDLWKQYQPDKQTLNPKKTKCWQAMSFEVLKAFSLYTNGKQMLNTNVGSGNLGALHGIRFFTMAWVILAHTYIMPPMRMYNGLINLQYAVKDVTFMVVWNSFVQVDSFFFLSGLVLVYTTMKKLNGKNGRLNLVRYVIHRYLRLTLPMMLVISLMFILPLISSGPLWNNAVESQIQRCRNTWWANMFYFSNFLNPRNACLSPYWYLSADMQLYLISPVVLITLYKWPRMGFGLITFGILASWVSVAAITLWSNFHPSIVLFDRKTFIEMGGYIHMQPYTHLGPYCIGLATGYLLLKHRNIKLKPLVVALGWIITTVSCSAVIFGAYDWHNGIKPNIVVGIIYASVHRTVFTLGLAWITCACVYGYGGPVNALLSWEPFIVLGRLTYTSYLIHPLVIYVRSGTVREGQFFSHFEQVCRFLIYLVLSMCLASVLHLIFEVPFMKLERFLLPQPTPSKSSWSSRKQKEETNGQVAPNCMSKYSSDMKEDIVTISRL
ncbi:nose resistant to fluoxetine protein 6-like [Limulus polyphemus]|uniref:Nose resistant to fluoxetine protein 6-like n=1 Tax=Limulus polyphemus TaxID=6850 RepID=A0ABM1BP11_LIMPO|nr:nose resistant to fluoxetine protein 6-like [Limulus polyphemus]